MDSPEKKTCDRYSEMLVLKHYGELGPDKAAELDAHLRACAACRAEQQELEATLGALPRDEPSRSQGNDAVRGVMGRIRKKERPAWRWLAPAAVAAACAVLLMLVFSGGPSREELPAPYPVVAEADLELLANYELLTEMDVLEDMEIAEILEDL
jgi:ferric-dicitrate binding protein FerR (iron transport regulator)